MRSLLRPLSRFETAVIATADPDDIRLLAAPFRRIGIFAL
jgi:hypothetical protein